jgi:Na+/melibiose symporter-like transporter
MGWETIFAALFLLECLLILMTVLPCLMMVISYMLYLKHYILDEDEYVRICSILEQRRGGSYEHQ